MSFLRAWRGAPTRRNDARDSVQWHAHGQMRRGRGRWCGGARRPWVSTRHGGAARGRPPSLAALRLAASGRHTSTSTLTQAYVRKMTRAVHATACGHLSRRHARPRAVPCPIPLSCPPSQACPPPRTTPASFCCFPLPARRRARRSQTHELPRARIRPAPSLARTPLTPPPQAARARVLVAACSLPLLQVVAALGGHLHGLRRGRDGRGLHHHRLGGAR